MKPQPVILFALLGLAVAPGVSDAQIVPVVDVLVVHEQTAFAASLNPQTEAETIVDGANDALEASGLAERYRLAAAQPVAITMGPNARDAEVRSAMEASTEISNLREIHAADLVVLVTEHLNLDSNGAPHCGAAWGAVSQLPSESLRNSAFRRLSIGPVSSQLTPMRGPRPLMSLGTCSTWITNWKSHLTRIWLPRLRLLTTTLIALASSQHSWSAVRARAHRANAISRIFTPIPKALIPELPWCAATLTTGMTSG